MGRIQDQNPANPPQNYNNNNPQPVEEVPPPSPYNIYPNIDEQINKPSPSTVNQPPYPPVSSVIHPPYPPTPPPAYPPPPPPPMQFPPTPNMGDFHGNNSTPVQFPPTKGDFQDNNSTPVQFPPNQDHGQYHQFQQQYAPQMNTNFDGTHQSPYNKPIPQQVPVPIGVPVGPNSFNESWSTELFDCMDDPMNAVTTLFFPCVTFGQIAEIIDNGQTSCTTSGLIYGLVAAFIGMPCIMSCSYRTKLRNKYGLIETPAPDWITHFLCEPCAICQAYRELQNRGLDPSIGWIGNVAKQQQQQQQAVMMAAPTYQTMNG